MHVGARSSCVCPRESVRVFALVLKWNIAIPILMVLLHPSTLTPLENKKNKCSNDPCSPHGASSQSSQLPLLFKPGRVLGGGGGGGSHVAFRL